MTIVLTEEFNNSYAEFLSYDAYDVPQREAISKLKHIDIRVFQQDDITTPLTVLDLSLMDMSELDLLIVGELDDPHPILNGEGWTNGTVAAQADRNNSLGLSLTCPISTTTTTESVMLVDPVNILDEFDDDDFISIAFPDFPLSDLDLSLSNVKFTSSPIGNFGDSGTTVTIAFSSGDLESALASGDTEFRIRREFINDIDLSSVTGVQFNIRATANTTFRMMAIRLLHKDWVFGLTDMDTRYGRLIRTVAPDGSESMIPSYSQPIFWRSHLASGIGDPKPIDGEMGVVFNTGSIDIDNSFSLYFRELTEDFLTQLDLNGLTQVNLDGNAQPDVGEAMYNPRYQTDLELFNQSDLDEEIQFNLERSPDFLSASWVQFSLQWQPGSSTITIIDTELNGYSFIIPGGLTASTSYVFFASIEENTVSAKIYEIDSVGRIGSLVYETTEITDDFAYKRKKGRFGWYANLQDGDAWIDSIRERGFVYGEYRSLPFESVTPVTGAELFVSNTPNQELFSAFGNGPFTTDGAITIERDNSQSVSGSSWRVTDSGLDPLQGIKSNIFLITDFENSEISFDLFYPSSAIDDGATLNPFLMDEKERRVIPLLMPIIVPDQWQHHRIRFDFDSPQLTGSYKFILIQNKAFAAKWWIDNPSIFSRSVTWDGRAVVDDPWYSNDADWTPFKNILNRDHGGVLFPSRGNQLQVRGRGLRSDSTISRIQFKPKYAELGNFNVGDYETPTTSAVGGFDTDALPNQTVRFTSTATDSDGYIAIVEWNFGDGGTGIGSVVEHQYEDTGSYPVTQLLTDNHGNRTIFIDTVGV